MRINHQKLKALSNAILELYRPVPTSEFGHHAVDVLARALTKNQTVTYNELPTLAHPELVVATNVETSGAKVLYPVFQQFMLEHPLVPLLFEIKDVPGTRVTDVMTVADFQHTNLFNEYYRKLGLDYQMACGFLARDSRAISFAINREGTDFSDEELFLFNCFVPHLRQAFELSHALEDAMQATSALEHLTGEEERGILCFDGQERIRFVSRLVEEVAWSHFHCRPRVGQLLPGPLRHCVMKLKGDTATGIQSVQIPLSFDLTGGDSLSIKGAFDHEYGKNYLVFERKSHFTIREQLRTLGISSREMDVAHWIIQGKTNWEIGKILGISPRTVDKHVERIFAKLGVSNRNQLATKARECNR